MTSGFEASRSGYGQEYALLRSDDGAVTFRGRVLQPVAMTIGERRYELFGLSDAADLLDEPDFAHRFEHQDLAPYGAQLWPAAVRLAECVSGGPPGGGRPALDLGCGLGLAALAAQERGWRVTAVDIDPLAVALTRFNAEHNRVDLWSCVQFDWRTSMAPSQFDLVLAADVLYERCTHQPILDCLRCVLARGGSALLADPNRGVADGFSSLATSCGFGVDVQTWETAALGASCRGRTFSLRHAG
jgi:predicted nicotinamide N-methyase